MVLLFVVFIVGAAIVWTVGGPSSRAIFPPRMRDAIVVRRREQERMSTERAQAMAGKPVAYGPLTAPQREELAATIARLKGLDDVEESGQSLSEAA